MIIIEELKCIMFVDSERMLVKVEHPTGKVTTKLSVGSEFDLKSISLARYQEFVLVYDINKLKIFDVSLDRFIYVKQFLKFPVKSPI